MKDDRNIEYLVGKKAKLDVFLEPFSFKIVSFLDDLSKALDNNSNNKNFPDLKALSFFCRKNNISKEGAAIKFIKNYNNVDKIILGVNSLKELKKNINNFLDKRKINFPKNLKINDEKILNPYNWRV